MRRILIGTPTTDGRIDARFANSLIETHRLVHKLGWDLRELYICYDSLVQNARNDIVAAAVTKRFDDLVFIDSDQDWEPEWFIRLLQYPVDCVGGTARKKTDDREAYNVRSLKKPIPVDPSNGLLIVDGLGAGFLRLTQRALTLLWDSSEEYRCLEKTARWIFDVRPIDGVLVGEDTMLTLKLQKLGIQTYFDPKMTCGHTGIKRFTGNAETWLHEIGGL